MRWDSVVEKVWKVIGGNREGMVSAEKFGRYKTEEVETRTEIREWPALKNKVKLDKHVEIYGGLSEGVEMKTYLHGPMDFAKTLRLRFRV